MNCEALEHDILRAESGELDAAQMTALDSHVAACERCGRFRNDLRQISEAAVSAAEMNLRAGRSAPPGVGRRADRRRRRLVACRADAPGHPYSRYHRDCHGAFGTRHRCKRSGRHARRRPGAAPACRGAADDGRILRRRSARPRCDRRRRHSTGSAFAHSASTA